MGDVPVRKFFWLPFPALAQLRNNLPDPFFSSFFRDPFFSLGVMGISSGRIVTLAAPWVAAADAF